jgi:hypothetical protein
MFVSTHLVSDGDTEEMDEPDVLVLDDLDLIDQAEPAQIVPQLLFRRPLIQSPEVHVPARIALRDCELDLGRHRARFAPPDLELLVVQRELFDGGIRVECRGCGGIEEGQKDARLLREDADGLEWTKVDEIEKLIHGRGRGEVADVNCAARGSVVVEAHWPSAEGGVRAGGVRDVHVERGETLVESLHLLISTTIMTERRRSSPNLSKVAHLVGISKSPKHVHVHSRHAHPEHVVAAKTGIRIAVSICLLMLLLLLPLLLKSVASGRTELRGQRHAINVVRSVDREGGGGVQRAAGKVTDSRRRRIRIKLSLG